MTNNNDLDVQPKINQRYVLKERLVFFSCKGTGPDELLAYLHKKDEFLRLLLTVNFTMSNKLRNSSLFCNKRYLIQHLICAKSLSTIGTNLSSFCHAIHPINAKSLICSHLSCGLSTHGIENTCNFPNINCNWVSYSLWWILAMI